MQVFDDQTGAEPGWKGGEIGGKCGWFPEAYVERDEEGTGAVDWGTAGMSNSIATSEDSSFMAVPSSKVPAISPSPTPGQVGKINNRIYKSGKCHPRLACADCTGLSGMIIYAHVLSPVFPPYPLHQPPDWYIEVVYKSYKIVSFTKP